MVKIIPAILTKDVNELRDLISQAEGKVERVQIDIIDAKFADNKTIDPSALEGIETNLKLDFHLMVKEPVNWVERCARAGAERIIGQIEEMADQIEFVGKVQETGAHIGLAIDLETKVEELDPVILTNLDVVLVMSVKAGFGGQKFDDKALDKIKELDEIRARDDTPYKILDDGGITLESVEDVRCEGVDEVVVGRRLFKGDVKENIDKFIKAAYQK